MMSVFNVQNAIDNAAALSILLTSMSASLLILGKMGTIAPTAYASIGIMTAVVAGLAVILGVMDGLGVTASIETAASLSILGLPDSGWCRRDGSCGFRGSWRAWDLNRWAWRYYGRHLRFDC